MAEAGDSGAASAIESDQASVVDPDPTIASLRARGADRFDPVGFRYIEVLADRRSSCGNRVRPLIEGRLELALADYVERFERAETETRESLANASERFPDAVASIRQRSADGDFGGMRRMLARLQARGRPGPLSALLDEIGRHAPDAELKSVERFRATWARLAVERRLSRSFAQAPENAGPLNSEHLVLRSLGLMRETSPDYLASFMSWADALFWLEQAAGDPATDRKSGMDGVQGKAKGKGQKKRNVDRLEKRRAC